MSYGLETFWDPENAEVDLVFVHGLFGNRITTWTKETPDGPVVWPRDLLKQDIPKARIYTFGYPANVVKIDPDHEVTQSTMETHASDLCNALAGQRARTMTTERPIIFVAHSLGGLICAKALVMGDRNAPDLNVALIAKCTLGMVFLGTPFGGSHQTKWGEFLRKISSVFTNTNSSLIKDLSEKSEKLRELGIAFAELLSKREAEGAKIGIAFFIETLTYYSLMIVDEDSAWIHGRGDHATVHANHIDICKYATREEEGYKSIVPAIEKIFVTIMSAKKARDTSKTQVNARDIRQLITGNPYIAGDFVSGDKDYVGGDKFTGDKNLQFNYYTTGVETKFAFPSPSEPRYIPRKASDNFTGRDDVLDELERYMLPPLNSEEISQKEQKKFVLYGVGGSGKTQVCLKFAEKHRDKFWGIFWVDATTPETAERDFAKYAKLGGFEGTLENGKLWISGRTENWLLVIDNADDPSVDISNYFPPCERGFILITSRNPDIGRRYGKSGSWEFKGMGMEDGTTLLLRSAEMKETDTASRRLAKPIVRELGGLALAIIQVGATIRQRIYSLEEYLDVYDRKHKELLQQKPGQGTDGYEYSVYTTWEISRQSIERLNSVISRYAVEILDISAFLYLDDVPENLFTGALPARTLDTGVLRRFMMNWFHGSSSIKQVRRDPDHIRLATVLLSSYSLIDFDAQNKGFSRHRLVHTWTRDRMEEQYRKWCQDSAATLLANSIEWERERREAADYALRRRLLPHVHSLLDENASSFSSGALNTDKAGIAAKFGLVCLENGEYSQAENLFISSISALERTGKRVYRDRLRNIHSLASVLNRQGKFDEAVKFGKQAVEGREKELGRTDPDTLESISELAITLQGQGHYDEAKKLGKEALERREKTLGIEHPDTIESVNNLARLLHAQGKYEEAEDMARKAVIGYEKALGRHHPDTLLSMGNLAVILRKREKYDEAELISRQVLRIKEESLGKEAPVTLMSVSGLAMILKSQRRYQEAEEMARRALDGYMRTFGPQNQYTLASIGNLAQIFLSQENYTAAEEMSRRALKGYEQLLGLDSPDTLISVYQLASVLETTKCFGEAIELYQRACAGYEKLRIRNPTALECSKRLSLLREKMERNTDKIKPDLESRRDLLVKSSVGPRNQANQRKRRQSPSIPETSRIPNAKRQKTG